MTRTQRMAAGQFMAFVAFLLLFSAMMIESRELGAAYPLLIFGVAFFGLGGAGTLPLRETPTVCRVFLALSFAYFALAAVWTVVAKQSWIVLLWQGLAIVGSVLAILGGWAYLRAATEERSQV